MALAHSVRNTDKDFKCVQCGSDDTSIVREDAVNPRCKCNQCQFIFSGEDSIAAQEAGAIKPSSPEALAVAAEPEAESFSEHANQPSSKAKVDRYLSSVPKSPSYVFISKVGGVTEFCTKRSFKKTAIKWSQGPPFNIYELKVVKLQVDVNFL